MEVDQLAAAKRDSELPSDLPRAATSEHGIPERQTRKHDYLNSLAECLSSDYTASAVQEEMRRTGADAVTASVNLRAAEARERRLAEYAFLSLAYALLRGLAPPARLSLKP